MRSSFYRRDAYIDMYRCRRRKEMEEDEYQRDCSDDCQVQSVALFLSNRGEFYDTHFCGRTVWTETTRSRENQNGWPLMRSRIESSPMKNLHQFNSCSQVQFIAECLCNVARKTYSWSRTKRQTASRAIPFSHNGVNWFRSSTQENPLHRIFFILPVPIDWSFCSMSIFAHWWSCWPSVITLAVDFPA